MKQLLLIVLIATAIVSCKKEEEKTTPTTTNTTVTDVAGNWTIKVYDGNKLTLPATGTLDLAASSSYYSTNTSHFDVTLDGSSHITEDGTYTTSANNTTIT